VEEGARIQTGDEAFKVESMKMEIPVESEAAGRIAQILVAVGDEVEEGQDLAVLD
jgi:acetyl-CoA carboxylase biotin carboxyl carrier protein